MNVSCYVAQFEEYYEPLIDHLVNTKMQHWEEEIRILAGKALSTLSVYNPKLVVEKYLPIIYDNCFKKALHVKHGALWGLSELILGLAGLSHFSRKEKLEEALQQMRKNELDSIKISEDNKNSLHLISSETLENIKAILKTMESKGLLKGKGGELMRLA